MSLVGFLRGYWHKAVRNWYRIQALRAGPGKRLSVSTWEMSLSAPRPFYLDCFRFFHTSLPPELKQHRKYFRSGRKHPRGFGEDAFHTLWYLLLEEIKPQNFLEIGVFRGQVISLVALWARLRNRTCEVHGISPFSPAADSVSRYPQHLDYYSDTLLNFDHFELPHPQLLRA